MQQRAISIGGWQRFSDHLTPASCRTTSIELLSVPDGLMYCALPTYDWRVWFISTSRGSAPKSQAGADLANLCRELFVSAEGEFDQALPGDA